MNVIQKRQSDCKCRLQSRHRSQWQNFKEVLSSSPSSVYLTLFDNKNFEKKNADVITPVVAMEEQDRISQLTEQWEMNASVGRSWELRNIFHLPAFVACCDGILLHVSLFDGHFKWSLLELIEFSIFM